MHAHIAPSTSRSTPAWRLIGRYCAQGAIYRLHDTTGDDLGLLKHPAPNIEPGDVVVVADGREAIVTARVEAEPGWGQLVALLEVAIAPTPLTSDESMA